MSGKRPDAPNDKLLVAAIDFGTTYSGWACSFLHEFKLEPTKVFSKNWHGGEGISQKAPTTVLIKPDGQTLEAFGYEAEDRYAELVEDNLHTGYYYFERFKMALFEKGISRNTTLEDDKGLSLPAKTVFSMAIGYLRDDVMKHCRSRFADGNIYSEDIQWVLTVPAIWDDASKQFMTESAIKAGISPDRLNIALEPEAASIFCHLLPVKKSNQERGDATSFKQGAKYMVLDCGGGTADVTVHEVMSGGSLKELCKASGGAWGGTKVDEAFRHMLITIFGESVLKKYQEKHPDDYLDIFRKFDIKKRDISPNKDAKITLHVYTGLKDLFIEEKKKDLKETIKDSEFANDITLIGDKLRIAASVYKDMFREAIGSIVRHVKGLLSDPNTSGTDTILMVGGFCESAMLQHAIKENFPSMNVVIPVEPGLAVLKGAVIYGHDPSCIAERVCRYTYGIGTYTLFLDETHDPSKKVKKRGDWYCKDIFDKHVGIGETVKFGEKQSERSYCPLEENQTCISFDIYASKSKEVMYITDCGCAKIGSFTIKDINRTLPIDSRSVKVSFTFSSTEIELTAIEEKTGKKVVCNVDFLG